MADEPKSKGDALKTNMTPGEQQLSKMVKPIKTTLGPRNPTRKTEAGATVRFTYKHHTGAGPEEIPDKYKEVFILHPNHAGKMHGIDLKRLTAAERDVIYAVFDPQVQEQFTKGVRHRVPLVNDILARMDPDTEIKNPPAFYQKFVKPFIRGKDVYRTYYVKRMWSVSVVQKSTVAGTITNTKPLFKRISAKADQDAADAAAKMASGGTPFAAVKRAMDAKAKVAGAQKPTPRSDDRQRRLDLIKARQAAIKKPPRPKQELPPWVRTK